MLSLLTLLMMNHVPPSHRTPVNHGPSTSGGGSTTISGETLRAGAWEVDWRTEWTEYEEISRAEAAARAVAAGEFDALESALLTSLTVSYGLTDDLELGAETGWYRGADFIDAEEDGMGGAESADADPSGLTDLWLTGKYRLMRGDRGHLAVVGGFKLPTGEDDEELSNGERLEPSSQPGSGAVDYRLGAGYSRYLSSRTTFDASGLFALRGEHNDFRVGDRLDLGIAVAHRLGDDPGQAWTIFGELAGVVLEKDEQGGNPNNNSGGTIIYASPGLRYRFRGGAMMSIAPSIPLAQDWNGDQIDTDFKIALTISLKS